MQLNDLRFGNPTREQRQRMEKSCMVDDLYEELTNFPFQDNDNAVTRKELNTCAQNLRAIQLANAKTADFLKTYLFLDRHLLQAIVNQFREYGLDVEKSVCEITQNIEPLIDKIVFTYNRMRPSQLANLFELALFPFENKNANTPSYPSVNTVLGIVILEVLCNYHPEQKDMVKLLIDNICNSQLFLGQHLQSDVDFAHVVANAILSHQVFIKKYAI